MTQLQAGASTGLGGSATGGNAAETNTATVDNPVGGGSSALPADPNAGSASRINDIFKKKTEAPASPIGDKADEAAPVVDAATKPDDNAQYADLAKETGVDVAEIAKLPKSLLDKLMAKSAASTEPDLAALEQLAAAGAKDEGAPDPAAAAQKAQADAQAATAAQQAANANQPDLSDFGIDNAKIAQLEKDFPELSEPVVKPMRQMATQIKAMADQHRQAMEQVQSLTQYLADQMVDGIIDGIGADEVFGKGPRHGLSKGQLEARKNVASFANAMLKGAAQSGKPITVQQAIEAAHKIKNKDFVSKQSEKAAAEKAAAAAKLRSNRPGSGAGPIPQPESGEPNSAAAVKINKILAKKGIIGQ